MLLHLGGSSPRHSVVARWPSTVRPNENTFTGLRLMVLRPSHPLGRQHLTHLLCNHSYAHVEM